MKKVVTAIVLTALYLSVNAQYHIRVDCYWNYGTSTFYNISFTNDNWKTTSSIMDSWDMSDDIFGNKVVYQEWLKDDKPSAVGFAKSFTSYLKCVSYNETIKKKYAKLLAYRNAHPIKVKKEEKVNCDCTSKSIY